MKAAALSIALVACGAGQPASPPPLSNHASGPVVDAAVDAPTGAAATLAKLGQLADAMCRCPDRDCADQVIDEMTRWAEELASAGEATPKVSSEQGAQAKAAADRISKCMADVYRRRTGSVLTP
jgi:hypothetical protein